MHNNYFDIVMEHIEENVTKSTEEIKRGIPSLIGRHSRAFSEHFNMLTEYTLDHYIKQRRLAYAVRDLVTRRDRSICNIALEYQFSDQSSFSRAVKARYDVTPNEIRKEGLWLFVQRFFFEDFVGKKLDTQVAKLIQSLKVGGPPNDPCLMLEVEQISNDYGFDVDTCYQIADLAERLGLPINFFAEYCFDAVADFRSDPIHSLQVPPPEVEFMTAAGLSSIEEMEAMCQHFKCEYYELDELKIYLYRKRADQQK